MFVLTHVIYPKFIIRFSTNRFNWIFLRHHVATFHWNRQSRIQLIELPCLIDLDFSWPKSNNRVAVETSWASSLLIKTVSKTWIRTCYGKCSNNHYDVIKWKHFPRYWPFVRGIHRSPVNSPHNGQWLDVFLDLRLNKPLSKHWWIWWFETLSRPLWRHCNV